MDEYLDAEMIAKHLSVTTETLRLWVNKKLFPPPIKLGQRCNRWKRNDIENFLNQKRIEAKKEKC